LIVWFSSLNQQPDLILALTWCSDPRLPQASRIEHSDHRCSGLWSRRGCGRFRGGVDQPPHHLLHRYRLQRIRQHQFLMPYPMRR